MFTSSSPVPRTQKKKTHDISFTRSTEGTSLIGLGLMDPEDGGTTFRRNVGIYLKVVLEDSKLQQYRCYNPESRKYRPADLSYRESHGKQTHSGGKIQRPGFRSAGLLRSTDVSGQHIGLFFLTFM